MDAVFDVVYSSFFYSLIILGDIQQNLISVTNGESVTTGFRDAAYVMQFKNGAKIYLCTGEIASENQILIAAHCLFDEDGKEIIMNELYAFVGSYVALKGDPYIAARTTKMPGYERSTLGPHPNDLAVIYLKKNITTDDPNRPITIIPIIRDASELKGTFQAAGWGYFDAEHKELSPNLLKGEFTILDNQACQDRIFSVLRPEQICFLGKNVALSKGDSGSGYVRDGKLAAINIAGTGDLGNVNLAVNLANKKVQDYLRGEGLL